MSTDMPSGSNDDNEVKSQLDLGEPPQHVLDWAKENIRENPETRDQVIQEFRDMIFERGECTPHRTDDVYLLRFLRCRNFSIEGAHKLLCNYYEFKENNKDFFEGISLENLEILGHDEIITVPPYREQTGRRILLYRMGNWDPESVTVTELFQASLLIMEVGALEPMNQILGGICIWDLEGVSLGQAWYLTPSIAYKMMEIMTTSFPMKVHAFHIVNQNWLFDMGYNIFKPLLTSDKMRQRLHIHGRNYEELHKHIDPKYLPKRYGGELEEYNSFYDWYVTVRKEVKVLRELKRLGYSDEKEEAKLDEETRKAINAPFD
ncbi:alpha-tocopherol transfer protein-like isoform X1 [Coccinella septempunctata]|uniref:alpha-tocopherol transfer protein-like isoform X1 n=2 Tax=Coccinella septempunctata TaxID=41139 RepID=UPI001D08F392|nr:alpha-tocopherol transfer protein-like isoform X1 [Coccinella septempunctata]